MKWKLSKIVTNSSILDVTVVLDPVLVRLIIDIVVSCNNWSECQSGLKCILQMLQKQMINKYE